MRPFFVLFFRFPKIGNRENQLKIEGMVREYRTVVQHDILIRYSSI